MKIKNLQRKKEITITRPLDPCLIPKFVNQLKKPAVYMPSIVKDPCTGKAISYNYTVAMTQFKQQLLPSCFPKTKVWGYEGVVKRRKGKKCRCSRSAPGPTFEVLRDVPANVQWVNDITQPSFLPVDPTLHWANPNNMPPKTPPFPKFPPGFPMAQSPVPLVTHLHGGEVRSDSDGGPGSWFTAGEQITGPEFLRSRYHYPNQQEPTTLWYHDHTLGTTRLNVYAGLAGFYIIRDPENPIESLLPKGRYEIPIVIQDRSFNEDGTLAFPNKGDNPNIHPYWRPSFSGNTIMVNGKVWPNLNVKRRQYRFRLLNGSNTRTYNLKMPIGKYFKLCFLQIGSDGGFLPKAVKMSELLLAPGERADVLIDFSEFEPGTQIIMRNDANLPFPNGSPPDPETVGQIMQFTVMDTCPKPPAKLPPILNRIPKFRPNVPKKVLTLNVIPGPNGTRELLLNGQPFTAPTSELPEVGSTVEWEIASLTTGFHPIHVHLIQFQVKNRQYFDNEAYMKAWTQLNGEPPLDHPTIPLPVDDFLIGDPIEPPENERGWKDTVPALPGQVTRLLLRFAPQEAECVKPGENLFPFDPSFGFGYVWHCHILDHEDNEMMRPMSVLPGSCNQMPELCSNVAVQGKTDLDPPALLSEPIQHTNEISAQIKEVKTELVEVSGVVKRKVSYTALVEDGNRKPHVIEDEILFDCKIDDETAREGNQFKVIVKEILYNIYSQVERCASHCGTQQQISYQYSAKDMVRIGVKRDD